MVRAEEVRLAQARRPSTFALKVIMAVTGVVFVAFVFVHMVGNLKVYGGAESLDGYARWLREVGYPLIPHRGVLWALRVVLLASLVAHVGASLVLWLAGAFSLGPNWWRYYLFLQPYRPYTAIGDSCIVENAEVEHSILLTGARTIWAILSPRSTSKGFSPRLTRMTLTSPR